jgi:hypothetical protein
MANAGNVHHASNPESFAQRPANVVSKAEAERSVSTTNAVSRMVANVPVIRIVVMGVHAPMGNVATNEPKQLREVDLLPRVKHL